MVHARAAGLDRFLNYAGQWVEFIENFRKGCDEIEATCVL